jgi:hypothetical protein
MNAEQYMRTNDELKAENKAFRQQLKHLLNADRTKRSTEGFFGFFQSILKLIYILVQCCWDCIIFLLECVWECIFILLECVLDCIMFVVLSLRTIVTYILGALFWPGLILTLIFGLILVQKAYDLGPDEALKKVPGILKAIDVYLDRVWDSVRIWLGMA